MASKPQVFFALQSSGSVRGIAALRQEQNGATQTLAQAIPDGDTISIHLDGSGAVRFLGIYFISAMDSRRNMALRLSWWASIRDRMPLRNRTVSVM